MIDTKDYEDIIDSIQDLDDIKDYLRELTRLILYDNMWGMHEAHERFLRNLSARKSL